MLLFIMLIMNISFSTIQTDSPVLIRISNNTHYVLNNLEINSPPSGRVHFGLLKPKEKSAYIKVKGAYAIAAVEAFIDNTKIEFLPDDYLGEQLLQPGKYTYELSVIEINGLKYLRLKLVADKK
jgi:hypothetical protein